LAYQWLLAGSSVAGETNSSLVRTNAQFSDSGSYSVIVTNFAGCVTSLVAVLTVTNPPVLIVQPGALDFGTISVSASAQAGLLVSNAGPIALSGTASISAGPFTFVPPGDAQLAIAPFTATNLVVTFAPMSAATFSNAVAFATDGGNSVNPITGQGIQAEPPLILWPAWMGADIVFYFATLPGKSYTVEFSDSLDAPIWQPLPPVAGDGTLKSFTDPSPSPTQRFYRLKVD
jgi:hypothetical protein